MGGLTPSPLRFRPCRAVVGDLWSRSKAGRVRNTKGALFPALEVPFWGKIQRTALLFPYVPGLRGFRVRESSCRHRECSCPFDAMDIGGAGGVAHRQITRIYSQFIDRFGDCHIANPLRGSVHRRSAGYRYQYEYNHDRGNRKHPRIAEVRRHHRFKKPLVGQPPVLHASFANPSPQDPEPPGGARPLRPAGLPGDPVSCPEPWVLPPILPTAPVPARSGR